MKNVIFLLLPYRFLYLCLIVAVSIAGCGKQVLAPLDAQDEYERAFDFFNNKKYNKAIESFERVMFYHAASEYVDDAQYWLARSYYEKKDYAQAIIELDYIIKNFANSSFYEEAHLFRAKAYYYSSPGYEKDQTETKEAIGHLDNFLTQFPNSQYAEEAKKLILEARNRMAKKELESGKLYMKMHEYDAAMIYFKYIIDNFPEANVVSEARYHLAGICVSKMMVQEALLLYQELLSDDMWKLKAEKKIKSLKTE